MIAAPDFTNAPEGHSLPGAFYFDARMPIAPALELSQISKCFAGVQALDDASFSLAPGEVHCLVGENGAGKSTLVKIIAGVHRKDSGRMLLHGAPIELRDVHHARSLGIGEIYQELMLVPTLSVVENIFLGNEKTAWIHGQLNWKEMIARTREVLGSLNTDISPTACVKDLSTAEQQMVEIAKALLLEARILIFDEPTGSLTARNTEDLFRIIRSLRDKGVSMIYISHRLEELGRIADRLTVMRDGKTVGTFGIREIDIPGIIRLMVGRDLVAAGPRRAIDPSAPKRLEVRGLCRHPRVLPASFFARAGEIVGIAGLVGAGRTELVRLIFGADRADAGEIILDGKPAAIRSPIDAVRNGIGLLTESRKDQGLVLGLPIRHNMVLPVLHRLMRWMRIDRGKEKRIVDEQMRRLRIASPTTEKITAHLSGGNQQKVVLAKWLIADCRVLIFDEPTRGVDVGAKAEIYGFMRELAGKGAAIVVVSSDLPEILTISDRVLVMARGTIAGELSRDQATEENIMTLMVGGNGNANS